MHKKQRGKQREKQHKYQHIPPVKIKTLFAYLEKLLYLCADFFGENDVLL